MLTRSERFKILKFISACCYLGCFPTIVDLRHWQLLQHSTCGRRWLSLAYYGFFILHSLYKIWTFFRASFSQIPPHELIIHAIIALTAPMIILWYYLLFIKHPSAFAIFLRITLTGNISGTVAQGKGRGTTRNFGRRLKECTLQDLVAINLPYMTGLVVIAFIVTYICHPNIQLLLYAGLPKQYQTRLSFMLLLFEEARYLLMSCAVAVPAWTLQVISFDLVNQQLKILKDTIMRTQSRDTLEQTYWTLRHVQIYITIINLVNRFMVFSWKLLCIAVCISTGYAAIANFGDHPIFGIMYYMVVIDCSFIYTISYGNAFKIPRSVKQASESALLRVHQGGYGNMKILKRQIRSVPRIGIKVGEFHMLERESTPVFVHYVLSNIVNMLVVCKH